MATFALHAQDRIIKKDKSEIKAKIIEISDTDVKYKKEDNPDGPTYSIKKYEVNIIIYKNGQVESFNDVSNTSAPTPSTSATTSANTNNANSSAVNHISIDKRYRYTLFNSANKEIESNVKFKDMMQYVQNDPSLLRSYQKHKNSRTLNQVYNGVFFAYTTVLLTKMIKNISTPGYSTSTLSSVILIVGALGDLVFIIPNMKKTAKAFVNDYNKKNSNTTYLKLGVTNNGVGFALNF